ncbi:MAG: hypothetical protein IJV39_02095 [Ruminococcus sp.]|nr:hypothetical protein [Ruminococcus sp.]
MDNLTKEQCVVLINKKFRILGRLPKKSDFDPYTVMMIKSHLGPWPRALEEAGIKPKRDDGYFERKQAKRERNKQRKRGYNNDKISENDK